MMARISDFLKIDKDPLYRVGKRIGFEKAMKINIFCIVNDMRNEGFTTIQIAKLTKFSIEEIETFSKKV